MKSGSCAITRTIVVKPDLTARETEVYFVLIKGKTDKEIADGLGLSTRTVRFNVSNILGKFGVARRIEFIAMAAVDREDLRLASLSLGDLAKRPVAADLCSGL
jgi:DNA-binding CsgD family transcriptional regulator